MKTYRLSNLSDIYDTQVFAEIMPGAHIYNGGFTFEIPGSRTHDADGGPHVHDDIELFLVLAGFGELEIDGEIVTRIKPGDIIVVEPGEDHHLISGVENPLVIIWCHAGDTKHVF